MCSDNTLNKLVCNLGVLIIKPTESPESLCRSQSMSDIMSVMEANKKSQNSLGPIHVLKSASTAETELMKSVLHHYAQSSLYVIFWGSVTKYSFWGCLQWKCPFTWNLSNYHEFTEWAAWTGENNIPPQTTTIQEKKSVDIWLTNVSIR